MKHASLDDPLLCKALGREFIDRINPDNPDHAPLRIGADVWTVHQLATELGVVHTRAARILTQAAAAIGAKDTRDFYERSTSYSLAGIEGFGTTTLYVAWRAFESRNLDPRKWHWRGLLAAREFFDAMKKREQAAKRRTTADAPRRHTGNTAPAPRPVSFSTLQRRQAERMPAAEYQRESKRRALGLTRANLRPVAVTNEERRSA